MEVISVNIEGLKIIKPQVFKDERGYFAETFNFKKFQEAIGTECRFVQDNESFSGKGVLRGLHFQNPPYDQGKLVRVSQGSVLDVAVDIRKSSPTYGMHHAIVLSEDNHLQFWIPPGFAHGFLTLEEGTKFQYKCTNYYEPSSEGTIDWNDKIINIDWGVSHPIISEKDKKGEEFAIFETKFD
jgi:dTDP-4-dehydrorhamnose 3,5-epimerase